MTPAGLVKEEKVRLRKLNLDLANSAKVVKRKMPKFYTG